ncbi:hypothetical protein BCE02nite_57490 [Brevibacillus centrosporus]|nr:hypothetical protein BCE02nite_57490 [Brevibacillus centrosporus]
MVEQGFLRFSSNNESCVIESLRKTGTSAFVWIKIRAKCLNMKKTEYGDGPNLVTWYVLHKSGFLE